MALLIPDARRGLLGGLIDDATLLCSPAPNVERAVEAYRLVRSGEYGWMVGRLVTPVSRLEELAGVLVRTMRSGDAPVPIAVVFDGETAANASIARAVHTMLDPAAPIEVVLLGNKDSGAMSDIVTAAAAGNGIHHGVLSMAAVPSRTQGVDVAGLIAAASVEALRPVGMWMDLRSYDADPVHLSAMIRGCVEAQVPFSIAATHLPGLSHVNRSTGKPIYGVMNVLAATLQADASESQIVAVLSGEGTHSYSIEFGGLTRNGESIPSRRSTGSDRNPLVSLATTAPADTLEALATLDHMA